MLKKTFIKGAALLSISQLIVAASTFIRNIIIARSISVEDFGIAATFAITLSLVEMTSSLSFDKILVQDKDGGRDEFLASAHFLQFSKSLITSSILFFSAPLVAQFFELQQTTWAFQLIAITPIIRGLIHFDPTTQQRNMNFAPTAAIGSIPQSITLILAYPMAYIFGDFKAVLTLSFILPIATVVISHLYATRPYRWSVNKALIFKKYTFGWPLMINGLLLFAIFNGDKSIVGRYFGMEALGWFGAMFALTLMPTVLFSQVSTTLLLPPLSRSEVETGEFNKYAYQSTLFCFAAGAFTWVFFKLGGEAVILLSYGEKYSQGLSVLSLLALLQAVRIIRVAPTLIALSQADTKNSMISNLVRMIFLPGCVFLAWRGDPIFYIVILSIAGEICALIISVSRLTLVSTKIIYVRKCLLYSLIFIGIIIITLALAHFMPASSTLATVVMNIILSLFIATILGGGFLATDKTLRTTVTRLIKAN